MPPKLKKSTQSNIASGKKVLKDTPIVTPTKTIKAKKPSTPKKVTPTRKCTSKPYKKEDLIKAVINTKTGRAKTFKTTKAAQDYLKGMEDDFGAEHIKDFQHICFDNKQDFSKACKAYANRMISTDSSIQQPSAQNILANLNIKTQPVIQALSSQKSVASIKSASIISDASFSLFEDLPPGLSASVPTTLLNPEQTNSNSAGCKFQLFLLPEQVAIGDKQEYQIYLIDFVEIRNNSTLWTHKPSAWEKVFKTDKDLSNQDSGQNVDEFFHRLRSVNRRNVSTGPNIKKVIITKNQKQVDCQILWGVMKCTENTENWLTTQIIKFAELASNKAIQTSYYQSMKDCGATYVPMLEQVQAQLEESTTGRSGEYWQKLTAACSEEIQIIHCQSLNEIFLDETIKWIMGILWHCKELPFSQWTPEMNTFAFAHQ